MADVHINYLAVLVAAVAYFFIGFVWYSFLFMKPYMKEMGFDKMSKKEQEAGKKKMGSSMFFNFIANLVAAYCVAWSVYEGGVAFHTAGLTLGLNAGFWIWLGYLVTSQSNAVLWGKSSIKLYLINIGYYLVSFLAMGAILALWQ